jgi:multiple sugar transport system permease protein
MLLPFAWMVAISLAPTAGSSFLRAIAGPWNLDHYLALFAAAGVGRYLVNSALVALVVVSLNVATAAMVGYILGRGRVPGERWWTLGIVATLMLPKQVLMVPLYLVLARMHMLDTYAALILPFAVDASASSWCASSSSGCRSSWRRPRAWMARRTGSCSGGSSCRC